MRCLSLCQCLDFWNSDCYFLQFNCSDKISTFFGSFKSRVFNLKRKIGLKIPFKKSWTRHRRSFLVSEWVIWEDKLQIIVQNTKSGKMNRIFFSLNKKTNIFVLSFYIHLSFYLTILLCPLYFCLFSNQYSTISIVSLVFSYFKIFQLCL